MVATSILSTDAEMNAMAGENVDTTGWSDAAKQAWGIQAEAFLVSLSRYDWATNVATLQTKAKAILSEYVARYVGMQGIVYNMLGDGGNTKSRIQSEDQINIHIFRMRAIEKLLGDQDFVNFILTA